jgi:hypothetical protein
MEAPKQAPANRTEGKGTVMFIERRVHDNRVELWECEWENVEGEPAHKRFIRCLGLKQPLAPEVSAGHEPAEAICWAYGRTLGNIAVFSQAVLGSFPGEAGSDAQLACDFVEAGKFRHTGPIAGGAVLTSATGARRQVCSPRAQQASWCARATTSP